MRVPLTSGAYQARGLIASAQRQVNLYAEQNPSDAQCPFTLYPMPGLTPFATPASGPGRGLYTASNGDVYAAVNNIIYYISPAGSATLIGYTFGGDTPISFVDNGLVVLISDGTSNGWQFDLQTRSNYQFLGGDGFYGFNKGAFLDTFILLNKPNTPQFYVSPSEYTSQSATPFNPLYFANMSTYPGNMAGLVIFNREVWLIGIYGTEFWVNSGKDDFPFQILPSTSVEYGCIAPYSIAKCSESVVWLSQDQDGSRILLRGGGYQAKRISNNGIETIWGAYAMVSDAIAWSLQFQGHSFYVITFPSQNVTWAVDVESGQFLQWGYGPMLARHRCAYGTAGYGYVFGQDWQTGQVYKIDPSNGTDAGTAIQRIRGFPHLPQNGKRARFDRFTADMQASALASIPVNLAMSRDRGATFIPLGSRDLAASGTLTQLTWPRLGMSRDPIFELSWNAPSFTALNGAFLDVTEATT